MERPLQSTRRPTLAAITASALVLVLASCGGDDFANERRPPKPIQVDAAISADSVDVSPGRFGAGVVTLTITNLTGDTQRVTLRSADRRRRLQQSTGPINPNDVASLRADLRPGSYRLQTGAPRIDPARIVVGTERPSAQNDLLQP